MAIENSAEIGLFANTGRRLCKLSLPDEVIQNLNPEDINYVYFIVPETDSYPIEKAIIVNASRKLINDPRGFQEAEKILTNGSNGTIYQAVENGDEMKFEPAV